MSSYYTRRFYRRFYQILFVLFLLFKPLVGAVGLGLFYFSMQQMLAVLPITATLNMQSFYYSQSSMQIDISIPEYDYNTNILVHFDHGPIFPNPAGESRPWYQRLGFTRYCLHAQGSPSEITQFSGEFKGEHLYQYSVFSDDNHFIEINGIIAPLAYRQKLVVEGSWKRPVSIYPFALDEFIFIYDDPVTWARIRVPNLYFKAKNLSWAGKLDLHRIEARLRIEKPKIKTSVYGTLSIDHLNHPQISIGMLNTDVLIIDANTHYVQKVAQAVMHNIRHVIDVETSVPTMFSAADLIDVFEELYPKFSLISTDGVISHHFDCELNQNRDVGLEVIANGRPGEISALMSVFPWVVWDKSLQQHLNNAASNPDQNISIVWNPSELEPLQFFAIAPELPMLLEGLDHPDPMTEVSS